MPSPLASFSFSSLVALSLRLGPLLLPSSASCSRKFCHSSARLSLFACAEAACAELVCEVAEDVEVVSAARRRSVLREGVEGVRRKGERGTRSELATVAVEPGRERPAASFCSI